MFTLLFAVTLRGATGKNGKTSPEFRKNTRLLEKKFEVVVAWRKKSIAVGIMYYNKHARQIVRGKATRLEAWKRNAPTKRKNQN